MATDLFTRQIDKKFDERLTQIDSKTKLIREDISLLRDYFTPVPVSGVVYRLINGRKVGYRTYGIWEEKRGSGYEITYEHTETYAGTTTTLNLDFQTQVMLKRIEQIWNDGTSKDFQLRMYSNFAENSYYSLLKDETGNTETSEIDEYNFCYPAGSRLQIYFSSYTAAKICKIIVAIEEL